MNAILEFSNSSIGKKIRVGATGLLLCGYLVIHLFGNLFVFGGSAVYNHYAHVMESNPVLPLIELALLAVFVLHILSAVQVTLQNMRARPVGYVQKAPQSSLSSRLMAVSGFILLAFLVVHVRAFRFLRGTDLYLFETETLRSRPMALFYLLGLAALFPHLDHGFQSAFNTLGLDHPKYTPGVKLASTGFALIIVAGFASVVVYFGFLGGGLP